MADEKKNVQLEFLLTEGKEVPALDWKDALRQLNQENYMTYETAVDFRVLNFGVLEEKKIGSDVFYLYKHILPRHADVIQDITSDVAVQFWYGGFQENVCDKLQIVNTASLYTEKTLVFFVPANAQTFYMRYKNILLRNCPRSNIETKTHIYRDGALTRKVASE